MAKILVTGGSGFIGTNLIDALLNQNLPVLNLDVAPPKKESHRTCWLPVDIRDYESLHQTITEFSPTLVIHLAARTDLRSNRLKDYSANTDGVENLLTVLDTLPELRRVIFASSMYVCQPGYQPQHGDDYAPHTVYGESKVLTEKIIKEKNPAYTWTIIRPTSIWGPYFGEPYDLFFKIVLGRKFFHLGQRACKKTYGYIDNTIYQIMSILSASPVSVHTKVVYLGDYDPYDISIWANEIAGCVRIRIPTLPFPIFRVAAKVGDGLQKLKVKFPITTFRLKNMTTDNILDLSLIRTLAPTLPVSRLTGTQRTIEWINKR